MEADLESSLRPVVFGPNESLAYFLARLLHNLTVSARATYIAGSDQVEDPVSLRRVNEAQLRITGILCLALADRQIDRELFLQSLLDMAEDPMAR